MKRQLCLMRHAKSSWEFDWLDDIERPLNQRGKRDAPRMAAHLATLDFRPEIILSSPATRAYTTARIVSRGLGCDPGQILLVEELYAAMTGEMIDICGRIDDDVVCAMVFGHNPTITSTANRLGSIAIPNVPTAGLVLVEFEGPNWRSALETGGTLVRFDVPKGLVKG